MAGTLDGSPGGDGAAGEDLSDPGTFPDTGPERTCIVTRRKGAPDTFIRFVVGPDRGVVPDLRCRLPGRGAWVTAERAVVMEAMKRKSFRRAFKSEVEVPPTLADLIDGLMEKDALQALSLANKAGLVVAGATKVEGSIGPKVPAALVQASDGSADGVRKMEAAVRRLLGGRCRCHTAHPRFSLRPIGFGTGAHKCDTRCGGRGNGRRGVCVASAAIETLPRGTAGASRGASTIYRDRAYRGLSETLAEDRLRRSQDWGTDTALRTND